MVCRNLARATGYPFGNAALLRQALTHRSFGTPHNERLEFLGDGVLNCVMAAILFERFPQLAEGELTRLRASFIEQESLVEIARQIDLGQHLLLGDAELKSGVKQRPSILADALEALIGGVFLDGGFEAAWALVARLFDARLQSTDPRAINKDAKTLLQEFLQARHIPLPQYAVIATTGGAHEQSFRVECTIAELDIRTEGEGTSRRSAEQVAARRAYDLGSRA
jgi:ribonuclease-3